MVAADVRRRRHPVEADMLRGLTSAATGSRRGRPWALRLAAILWGAGLTALAATRYVDLNNPTPTAPYTSWATAATTIQDAVDAAAAGDEIVVTDGTYATGGKALAGFPLMTNRVAIDKAVTVRSVNGPLVTVIAGQPQPGTTNNGDGAIRCVYVGTNAVLSGFTLTNGHTRVVEGGTPPGKRTVAGRGARGMGC